MMIQFRRIFKFFLLTTVLFCVAYLFLNLNVLADEKKDRYKQLTEEEREIIQMLDFLENYEMLKEMEIIEMTEISKQDNKGKDTDKSEEHLKGGKQ